MRAWYAILRVNVLAQETATKGLMKQGRSKDYLKGTRRGRGPQSMPVDKLLRSKIGKNWDTIYKEFSEEFKHGTLVGDRFFESVGWQVALNCWKGADSGTIYDSKGVEVFGWFVHPLSNCLEFKKTPVRKTEPKPLTEIKLNDGSRYEKTFGIWYHVTYSTQKSVYSGEYPISKKRQLSAHELKRVGVHNDSLEDQLEAKEEQKKKDKLLKMGIWHD